MTSATRLGSRRDRYNRIHLVLGAMLGAVLLTACNEKASEPGAVRPVRTQVVEITKWSQIGTAVGEIKPRYESDISFRIGGKIAERPVDVGANVDRNTIIARLDGTNEETARRISESDLNVATAEREDARRNEGRQREPLQQTGNA